MLNGDNYRWIIVRAPAIKSSVFTYGKLYTNVSIHNGLRKVKRCVKSISEMWRGEIKKTAKQKERSRLEIIRAVEDN